MDDVIFSGTNNRPGRNNAEVAIQLDNSARKAPAQFNEHDTLDISRRIERDAGSTYRINGREVRARDVHILFADASTGSRSPSMVHQGRIGEIIQAKPEQRRRVLEEAAGISGLHALEARLCRWLLQTHDCTDGNIIPLTQEFLGQMLGVRRTTVTIAARLLQGAGLIRYRRGHIQILDRAALEEMACECYGVVRQNANKVFPPDKKPEENQLRR